MRRRSGLGTVTVAAGRLSKTFPVTTIGGTVPTTVTITATYSGVAKTATLTVNPAWSCSSARRKRQSNGSDG